jgi:hypothetical protein
LSATRRLRGCTFNAGRLHGQRRLPRLEGTRRWPLGRGRYIRRGGDLDRPIRPLRVLRAGECRPGGATVLPRRAIGIERVGDGRRQSIGHRAIDPRRCRGAALCDPHDGCRITGIIWLRRLLRNHLGRPVRGSLPRLRGGASGRGLCEVRQMGLIV